MLSAEGSTEYIVLGKYWTFITLEGHLNSQNTKKNYLCEKHGLSRQKRALFHTWELRRDQMSPRGTQKRMCMSMTNIIHPSAHGCKWPTRPHVVLGLQIDVHGWPNFKARNPWKMKFGYTYELFKLNSKLHDIYNKSIITGEFWTLQI